MYTAHLKPHSPLRYLSLVSRAGLSHRKQLKILTGQKSKGSTFPQTFLSFAECGLFQQRRCIITVIHAGTLSRVHMHINHKRKPSHCYTWSSYQNFSILGDKLWQVGNWPCAHTPQRRSSLKECLGTSTT